jgi:hypothetical protein
VGKIWLDCFDKLDFDMDTIDDGDDATWEVPCHFRFGYVGYSGNSIRYPQKM